TRRRLQVVKTVDGVRRKRLGGTGIEVSELALGTQRWGGTDYNSPDEALCHAMLDRGVLEGGINLLDTAAQYPIPSGAGAPAGRTEEIIGSWIRKSAGRRNKIVIASKITGGRNVNKRNILADCDASLRRLGVDQLDVYMLHWPARYTPQANWGQSLEYDWDLGRQTVPAQTQFSEIVEAMAELERAGKIRGYGACNDNAVGLMGMAAAARVAGVAGPCAMQNDYSLINRRTEENGLSEASSPALENCGFMAYNVLAGGMLTGKYDAVPAAVDDADRARAETNARAPRGRMDTRGWGNTLGRYRTAAARDAAMRYAALARDFGLSGPTELALRFAASRPAVTTSLVGHTSLAQLDESVAAFRATARKPLSRELLWEIDRVHLRNRLPLFANDEAGSDWFNEGAIGERIP
ncbi:putative aldo/keto reductase family protein, partial [Pelagophyceae sp. CCMP2097]